MRHITLTWHRIALMLLALVPALLLAPLSGGAAFAHDVPPVENGFQPGQRYKPYAPEDPAYAVHYRPYVPARAVAPRVHHPRKVVRVRPAQRHHVARVHKHHHHHAKPARVADHRHVKTRILRPRVVCGDTYNYWGPERLCQTH